MSRTCLMEMSLVLRLPHETHLFRSCSNLPHMCPNVVWFWHFDFEMCSATTRALFEQLNCQKCSGPALLCAFWLRNVLRAKVVCAFSTTQLPKVLRQWGDFNILASTCASCQSRVLFCNKLWAWGVFNILTSKCASRHSGGQFLISHGSAPAALASLLFNPPEPQNIRKTWANAAFRRFSTFSHTLIFFLLALSLSSAFSHHCCCISPYVGSLTSKLPSKICT